MTSSNIHGFVWSSFWIHQKTIAQGPTPLRESTWFLSSALTWHLAERGSSPASILQKRLPQPTCHRLPVLTVPRPGVSVDQTYLELTARKFEVPEEQGTYVGINTALTEKAPSKQIKQKTQTKRFGANSGHSSMWLWVTTGLKAT